MKKINWLTVSLIAIIAIPALFWIGTMIGGWGYRGFGMMGNYGSHMGWSYLPFGWTGMGIGMLFMLLIPVGVIALVVLGVASLVRNTDNLTSFHSQPPCPNCGKGTQDTWQNCPYCGAKLK